MKKYDKTEVTNAVYREISEKYVDKVQNSQNLKTLFKIKNGKSENIPEINKYYFVMKLMKKGRAPARANIDIKMIHGSQEIVEPSIRTLSSERIE